MLSAASIRPCLTWVLVGSRITSAAGISLTGEILYGSMGACSGGGHALGQLEGTRHGPPQLQICSCTICFQ